MAMVGGIPGRLIDPHPHLSAGTGSILDVYTRFDRNDILSGWWTFLNGINGYGNIATDEELTGIWDFINGLTGYSKDAEAATIGGARVFSQMIIVGNGAVSPDGGFLRRLINKTGAASVKGEIVKLSTAVDAAVMLTVADDTMPIGPLYESGVADGELVWSVVYGDGEVMLKDTVGTTHGNWMKTADVAGRVDGSLVTPPGGGVAQLDEHLQEVGHSGETKAGGVSVLAHCHMHPN